MPTSDTIGDIALIPTLLASITHSIDDEISITKRDYREKVKKKKISTHTLIILDTSSSMMEGNKLSVAKSCLDELFLDTYQKRDKIALITAGGEKADYLLPFTSNVERGKELIEEINFGGTSPLSSGFKSTFEILSDIKKREPWIIPIAVIITDGKANVSLSPGRDVEDELIRIGMQMDEANIRPLIVDVGESSHICKKIADAAEGEYIWLGSDSKRSEIDLEKEFQIDDILQTTLISMLSRDIDSISLENYDPGAVERAINTIHEEGISIPTRVGCDFNCPADGIGQICRECELIESLDESQEIRYDDAGIEFIKKEDREEDVLGSLFVKYILEPGKFSRANRGIIYFEDEETYLKYSEFLEGVFTDGYYIVSNEDFSQKVPFRPNGVFVIGNGDDLDGILPESRSPKDDLDRKIRECIEGKSIFGEVSGMIEKIQRDRRRKIRLFNELLAGQDDIYIDEFLSNSIMEYYDQESSEDILKYSKALALLDNREKVTLSDLKGAISELKPSTLKIDEEDKVVQYLVSKLMPTVANKEEIKFTLVKGYSKEVFLKSLEAIERLDMDFERVEDCNYNCDPSSMKLCDECSLKDEISGLESSETGIPVVKLDGGGSLEDVRGELFVRYLPTSDILIRANRGFLVIDSLEEMDEDVLRFLSHVLENGEYELFNDGFRKVFEADFSIITLVDDMSKLDENQVKFVDKHCNYFVSKEGYEDILPKIYTDESQMCEDLSQKGKDSKEARNKITTTEDRLDNIARICSEFDMDRNDIEIKIDRLSRAFTAWKRKDEVENEEIIESAQNLISFYRNVAE
ncbi:MAG: VWA domain-containing protein [Thermoplasmatota archaeon]